MICVKILNSLDPRDRRYDWSMHCTVDGLAIGAETATWASRTAKFTSMHLREGGQDFAADLVFGFLVSIRTGLDTSQLDVWLMVGNNG